MWATQVYGEESGKVFTSLTNWVAGDLEKNKPVNAETTDIYIGDTEYITIKTGVEPEVVISGPGGVAQRLQVRRTATEQFEAVFTPQQNGVYLVKASSGLGSDQSSFCVNYPREYSKVGTNLGALKTASESTGGGVYDESSVEELAKKIAELSILASKRKVAQEKPLYHYFVAAALLIYFLDTCARRILEIYKLRKGNNNRGGLA
jgi:hypothetical protein